MTKKDRLPVTIPTQIKNADLVDKRRIQIVDAAVELFIANGFHKTTTREIARHSGISIGLLYEYVNSKEDILFLVCDAIHNEVENGVTEALGRYAGGKDSLAAMIREYFMICDRMSDHILLIYQETRSLPSHWRSKVLEKEIKITEIFVDALIDLARNGGIPDMDRRSMTLMAHNIVVLGHMWTFRRWEIQKEFGIEEYIRRQTDFVIGAISGEASP